MPQEAALEGLPSTRQSYAITWAWSSFFSMLEQIQAKQTSTVRHHCTLRWSWKDYAAAMLLEFGASKDAVDETGETPYDWAVWAGQVECQHLLLGLPVERKKTLKEMRKVSRA